MAYSKLIYCNSDHILGFQTVNQARDNLDSVFSAMDVEHVALDIINGYRALGQHDSELIPKDVIKIQGASAIFGSFQPTNLLTIESGQYIFRGFRAAAGQYFLPLEGLSTYWGEAVASVTSATPKPLLICRSNFTSSTAASQGPGIYVACYEMGTGAMVLTDFDLTLTVYGVP